MFVCMILNAVDVQYWFGAGFGDITRFATPRLNRFYTSIMGSFIGMLVQLYLSYRIIVLRRRLWALTTLIALVRRVISSPPHSSDGNSADFGCPMCGWHGQWDSLLHESRTSSRSHQNHPSICSFLSSSRSALGSQVYLDLDHWRCYGESYNSSGHDPSATEDHNCPVCAEHRYNCSALVH